jgi:hypothetical protein
MWGIFWKKLRVFWSSDDVKWLGRFALLPLLSLSRLSVGHMQSMTITTKVEEFRSWAVYSIKHYVMKFVSYLRQAVVFPGNSGFVQCKKTQSFVLKWTFLLLLLNNLLTFESQKQAKIIGTVWWYEMGAFWLNHFVTIIRFSSNHEMLKAQINVRVIIKATGQNAPIILHHHLSSLIVFVWSRCNESYCYL